jgi:hypothetical protein
MFDLFAHEFGGLRTWGLALFFSFSRALQGSFLWHEGVPHQSRSILIATRIGGNPRLTWVSDLSYDAWPVIILAKLLITASLVGLLRTSSRFQSMSRELDEHAFAALKRIMNVTEECGYPRELIPLLILLTALSFMLSMAVTAPGAP